MLPEDDYLRLNPERGNNAAIHRIALMALVGCLLLLSVLVIQARMTPGAASGFRVGAVHHIENQEPPLIIVSLAQSPR